LGSWGSIILDKLDSLKEVGSFCQNLIWPLFVAATEIPWDEERQKLLETRIQQIVELSGHWKVCEFWTFYGTFGNWVVLGLSTGSTWPEIGPEEVRVSLSSDDEDFMAVCHEIAFSHMVYPLLSINRAFCRRQNVTE
jgi:hypothetical protein